MTPFLLFLTSAGCGDPCAPDQYTEHTTIGGGTATLFVHGADGPLLELTTTGVADPDSLGGFADGESGVLWSSQPAETGEPAPTFPDGQLYVAVCAEAEVADCGLAPVCFWSGWLADDALDGRGHAGGTLAIAGFGTSNDATDSRVTVTGSTTGSAAFSVVSWRDDVDLCLKGFVPTGVNVEWAFDPDIAFALDVSLGCE